jgi:hypothetical protein
MLFALQSGPLGCAARAQNSQSPADEVLAGCKPELEKYCKDVTPGEGRILACLYAHGDKLSGRCEYALYDAAVQLERAVAALSYAAKECDDDMETLCPNVPMGEGRVAECLNKQSDKLSKRCAQAMEDIGLKK